MKDKEVNIKFNNIIRKFLLKTDNTDWKVGEIPSDIKISDNYAEEIFQHTDIKDIFYERCDLLELIEPLENGSFKTTICHPEDDYYPHKVFAVDVAVKPF